MVRFTGRGIYMFADFINPHVRACGDRACLSHVHAHERVQATAFMANDEPRKAAPVELPAHMHALSS